MRHAWQEVKAMTRWCLILALGISSLLAACGRAAAPAETKPSTPSAAPAAAAPKVAQPTATAKPLASVRIGMLGLNMSNAGIYIANQKGYFREQGIQLEESRFDDGLKMIPLLSQGQLDVAAGGPGAAFYNALSREPGLRIVADKGNTAPGADWSGVVIRKDLWDAGKRTLNDLKGESIALVAPAGSQQVQLERYIEPRLGLKAEDLNEVYMPFPDMAVALKNKAVGAAMPIEPGMTVIVKQGLGEIVYTVDQFEPYGQTSMLMFSADMAANTDVGKGFIVAYLKGVRDYVDAFKKKGPNRGEIVQLLVDMKVLANAEQADDVHYTGLNPNGYVYADALKAAQDWLAEKGLVKEKADLDKAIDNGFVDYAVKVLGEYQ
ncbi:MAG TPA: ABC transporter substrate-binding protein [Chloroflexota bacterium]|nr:ABC transporter substrate-binding protein [Chloroflexota bacterium]